MSNHQLSGRLFLACFISGFFCIIQFILQTSPALIVDQLISSFDTNHQGVGLISSAFYYPYILLQIPAGLLVDRYGSKRILCIASLGISLSALLLAHATSLPMAILARGLTGASAALGVLSCMGMAAKHFDKHFILVAAYFEVMALFGAVMSDYLAPDLLLVHNWRVLIEYTSLLPLSLFLVVSLICPKEKPDSDPIHYKAQLKQFFLQTSQLAKTPHFWQLCFFGGFVYSVINSFGGLWSIHFFQTTYPAIEDIAHQLTATLFIGSCFGTFAVGLLLSHFRLSQLKRFFSLISLLSFSCILFINLSWLELKILLFALGFATSSYILAFEDIKRYAQGRALAANLGLLNMLILFISGPLLQPIMGLGFDYYQSQGGLIKYPTWIGLLPMYMGLLVAFGLTMHSNRSLSSLSPCSNTQKISQ